MASKLKLIAEPTFKAEVGIPVAGGDTVDVAFTFKHRTKDALDEFVKSRADKSDVESFMDMVVAWDFEDEFNKESVALLLQNRIGVALATYRTYVNELISAKLKN